VVEKIATSMTFHCQLQLRLQLTINFSIICSTTLSSSVTLTWSCSDTLHSSPVGQLTEILISQDLFFSHQLCWNWPTYYLHVYYILLDQKNYLYTTLIPYLD